MHDAVICPIHISETVITKPAFTHTHLIVVSGKVRDEADVFGADSLHSSLDAHRGLLLCVLTGARPLGGVVVGQLPYPVSKANLDISIEGGHWEGLRRRRGGREGGRVNRMTLLCVRVENIV